MRESKFVLCQNTTTGAQATLARTSLPWQGWVEVHDVDEGPVAGQLAPNAEVDEPSRNASTQDWRAFAVRAGADPAQAAETTRTDLIARYASEENA